MNEYRHEIVNFSSRIPVKIFFHRLGEVPLHWHHSLELLIVLEGEVELKMDHDTYHLKTDDIVLVNSNCMHRLFSENAVLLAMQINLTKFDLLEEDANSLYFNCNSSVTENQEGYQVLKSLIARMIRLNASGTSDSAFFHNKSLSYSLLAALVDYFRIPQEQSASYNNKNQKRLTRILAYINSHYQENLTLQQVAETEGLSAPYFSVLFNKNMGINFSDYYSYIRLEHAFDDLKRSSDSIETIALRNGYTEPHAFVRSFKNRYGLLPSVYRKNTSQSTLDKDMSKGVNYLLLEPGNYLYLLAKYLPKSNGDLAPTVKPPVIIEGDLVDFKKKATPFGRAARKFIGVGSAKELLFSEVQHMLSDLQREVGFEYVKFHGILSDEMLVCNRTSGSLHFSFVLVDKVLDFLLSIRLKPMIQLSFMPAALAANPDKRVFENRFITSLPKDMKEWDLLIRTLIKHLLVRYGEEQVESWLFTLWNEPDTDEIMFSVGGVNTFVDFYINTYKSIKSIHPKLLFGAPSVLIMVESSLKWAESFITQVKKRNCEPDFLLVHYYSDDFSLSDDKFSNVNLTKSSRLFQDPDYFSFCIDRYANMVGKLGVGSLPIYLSEWNLTVSHRSLINDTCFISAYLARNLLLNENRLASFGLWSLTDLICEYQVPETLFHGGMGMYTQNGIRKPAFYVYYFIKQLGAELIAKGSNYVVTRDHKCIRLICWNYEHFCDLYADGETFDMTSENRYSPFLKQQSLKLSIPFENLPGNRCTIREQFINRKYGSVYDKWLEIGSLPVNSQKEIDLLKQSTVPGYFHFNGEVSNGKLTYAAILEPFEVRYTEIELY